MGEREVVEAHVGFDREFGTCTTVKARFLGLGLQVTVLDSWEGFYESRSCSRDTCPESYITEYTSIRRFNLSSCSLLARKRGIPDLGKREVIQPHERFEVQRCLPRVCVCVSAREREREI